MEEFRTQLRSLENSMLLKAKQKVRSENKILEEQIKITNDSFVKQMVEDLLELTGEFMKNYEYRLNKLILENVNELNQKILDKKNVLFGELKKHLIDKINDTIDNNSKKYFQFLCGLIKKHLIYFDSTVKIQLTNKDQKILPELTKTFPDVKFQLIKEPLQAIGGVLLTNQDSTMIIDETIDNIISSKENAIKTIFGQIFAEYRDTRKNATELMQEKSVNNVFEMPKELSDFIEQEKIKFER